MKKGHTKSQDKGTCLCESTPTILLKTLCTIVKVTSRMARFMLDVTPSARCKQLFTAGSSDVIRASAFARSLGLHIRILSPETNRHSCGCQNTMIKINLFMNLHTARPTIYTNRTCRCPCGRPAPPSTLTARVDALAAGPPHHLLVRQHVQQLPVKRRSAYNDAPRWKVNA